jgi:predicted acyl esterase
MNFQTFEIASLKGSFLMDKDVWIPVRDQSHLCANVFRPKAKGKYPVLVTLGPYGKDVHLSQFMPGAWEELNKRCPEIAQHSSLRHLVFETPDPESWVHDDYVILKVDSRGAGKSAGMLDVNSPAEFNDLYDVIEWAAAQLWCNGRVGLLGISYYAAGQWMIASLKPPHLSAILPWQGASDFYRDRTRQGGIFGSGFAKRWWNRSVLRNQHGNPESPFTDIITGARNTGTKQLSPAQLALNRVDYIAQILAHPLDGDFYRARSPVFENIDIPALVVANYGGLGLHLRGTVEGYLNIASKQKWLKIQSGSYFLTFLTPENVALQKRFFDRYLRNIPNGWEDEPNVEVAIRSKSDTVLRQVQSSTWPIEGTQWTPLYLNAANQTLSESLPAHDNSSQYHSLSEGASFFTAAFSQDFTFAGPAKVRLFVSSSSSDMDLFVTLRAFDEKGQEITFFSATEPRSPVTQGWLRVSQRKLDPQKSLPYRPFHSHGTQEPLTPGEIYEVEVEIWPSSLCLNKGHRLSLVVQGQDFERLNESGEQRGSGWFLHNDPQDRPTDRFESQCRVLTGPTHPSCLVLPVLKNL